MNRSIIIVARIFSGLFRPTYYPTVAFILMLTLTHLRLLPWQIKLLILGIVYFFTKALPGICVFFYRRYHGWEPIHLRIQHRRVTPYLIHILCYLICLYILKYIHIPHFVCGIIVAALLIQCCCILLNIKWKVSVHSAGAGGLIGALVAFSELFGFYALWWLCGTILLAGCVMTSRMLLRQHSLWQVLGGCLVGGICGFIGIIF